MKKFFTILVLVLIFVMLFGVLAFAAENRFKAESSGIAGLVLLTDWETECKYLASSSSQSILLPDCWRK